MENYKRKASATHDMYNMFDIMAIEIQGSFKNQSLHQNIKLEMKENNELNIGVLKAISNNNSKWLGIKQETRMAIQVNKNSTISTNKWRPRNA